MQRTHVISIIIMILFMLTAGCGSSAEDVDITTQDIVNADVSIGETAGEVAEVIDPCAAESCMNGATCSEDGDSFTCECPAGYTGAICEEDIDDCVDVACLHGGSCVDEVNGYHCDCVEAWTGDHCETCEGVEDGDSCTAAAAFTIPDTGQTSCWGTGAGIACPGTGEAFSGQDASYSTNIPSFTDNGDGTITDNNTGLMWIEDPGAKKTWAEAVAEVESYSFAGYDDWRLPTIKELYSLVDFSGVDPSGCDSEATCPDLVPFMDTDYFVFSYGNTSTGERMIDSQMATTSIYVSTVFDGTSCMFGFNFADGRIKCYPHDTATMGGLKTYFAYYVRGAESYGLNDFTDNSDGTVTDAGSGLMWQQEDSGQGLNWEAALEYCENLMLAGYDDWRLPDAKELQGIVDYTRSPTTTNSPAIDPVFSTTSITDEGGNTNWPFFWTSTTHIGSSSSGKNAAYVAFGEALGFMEQGQNTGVYELQDVHGAGAQRSDPKDGNPDDYPNGFGPQGDVIRIFNFARCVRGGGTVFDGSLGQTPWDPNGYGGGTDACASDADCTGDACPDGALSCTCATTNEGKACLPACTTDNDCPNPPDLTLICTDGVCMPDDSGTDSTGPATCSSDSDCTGDACSPDAALGCTCIQPPQGDKICVPKCNTTSDCPGDDMTCAPMGFCVPEGEPVS